MSFSVPESVRPLRARVRRFVDHVVIPRERELDELPPDESFGLMRTLMQQAKVEGLWALGHPKDIGGQGLAFLDYVYVNEIVGRSEHAMTALGTHSLQDALMLQRYASPEWRAKYLGPLVAGEFMPSFAMTEPDVASSDPTQLKTRAVLEGDTWVIHGRKWFTTHALRAAYTTVMCRTEPDDVPAHEAFSMIVVPTDNPSYRILRDPKIMGNAGGHPEVLYDGVRVPSTSLLGPRGAGFKIAQQRLGPGRIFHAMRWLGQAQRAFDLMCARANSRVAFGQKLADKQLVQKLVFDAAAQIQAARLLTLHAAHKMDQGDEARVEIGLVKVVGAKMVHDVIDAAIQVHGAAGVSEDFPLERMYRAARFARIYDGPDEVHIESVGKRLLRSYACGEPYEFGA
jgi:alkylation response protein AidB-like acyl-CoA dehydrogenase